MEVITNYKDVADLKNKIIASYLKEIDAICKMHKRILSDKGWASTGSEYHNKCRADKGVDIAERKKQIKLLKPTK